MIMVPYYEKDGHKSMKSIQQYMNHLNNSAEHKQGESYTVEEVKELLD